MIRVESLDHFNLIRFVEAQSHCFGQALEEIKRGRKHSHWMWYIFPQFRGLGSSQTSEHYAIRSREEALAYKNHIILGPRLIEITSSLMNLKNHSAYSIFGSPDDLKLKSSMTLFNAVQNESKVFELVLDKYFTGFNCQNTLRFLGQ